MRVTGGFAVSLVRDLLLIAWHMFTGGLLIFFLTAGGLTAAAALSILIRALRILLR